MSYFRLTYRLLSTKGSALNSTCSRFDKVFGNNKKSFVLVAAATFTTSNGATTIEQSQQQQSLSQLQFQHQMRKFSSHQSKKHNEMNSKTSDRRSQVSHEITKNITLYANEKRNVDRDVKTLRLKHPVDKPLVLMLSWLLAKQKHIAKYAKIYTDQGYDVLAVEITPWQLLWPTKGTQLVALDVLNFLENNTHFSPIILHGFSVGGYQWGECMVHMARDMKRYKPILDRIVAQIWDSAADITEIPIGVPKSIFPRNPTLQKALRNYTIYHLKTFHEQATTHYIRSSQIFHSTLVKAPALFFLSKNDPIGAEKSNQSVRETMESLGIKCDWKCWDRSAHVLHYYHHTEEYLEHLYKHLDNAMMEWSAEKTRAKL